MRAFEKLHEIRKSVARKAKIVNQKINKHLSSFQALHSSSKMERLDYTFKFSTELVVVTLSLIIVGVNAFGSANLASANNLFTKLLAYHPEQNPNLYAKTTTVKTVLAQDRSVIIPSASAQVVLASTDAETAQPASLDNQSDSIINNNTIQKENPDSVKTMIADQIKVYDTVSGDSLQSVGSKFNISRETVAWANNLPVDATLKPGWNLVILPVSGVLHKVTNNDTLGDIAKKYNADINQIISYNGLEDESDVEPGDLLIIPGGKVPIPVTPKPKPAVKHVVAGKTVYEPAPGGIEDYGGRDHIFPWGQCTYYAAKKRGGVPWGGNAKNWLANAKAYGASTGKTPVVGAIVVTNENRRYGHVAYVEKVDGNRFYISEMNFVGLGKVSYRWLNANDPVVKGFIY
jgi:surface antigen/LysM repeat protein